MPFSTVGQQSNLIRNLLLNRSSADTSLKLQQIMNKYQLLKQLYSSLAEQTHHVNFHNNSIRDIDHHGRLERAFFAFAALLSQEADNSGNSYIIMVTASHNPPGYNGLKVDAILGNLKLNQSQTTQTINSPQMTMELIQSLNTNVQENVIFYVGRDKRLSSPRLSSIIKEVLQTLYKNVVDLGERSTPQLFSLSQFLHERHIKGQPFTQELITTYFQVVKQSFCKAVTLISQNLNKKWQKKTICLDFSNGVGGQALKNYTFLNDFFDIKVTNFHDFHQPNVSCGAEWFYKHFKTHKQLPQLHHYPQAEEYYFFDGDSDRIIGNMAHQNAPIDGDDFNACFVRLLRELLNSINMEGQEIGAVGNITSNQGLQRYMKALNVNYSKAAVGVRYLFAEMKKHQIGCYFQNSGHGCLYFSKEMRKKLEEVKQKFWQAELLIMLDGLSRNNSRGYAFHDMLIFQIYLYYFGAKTGLIFEKSYILNKEYQLSRPQLFVNGKTGGKLLQKPQSFIMILKKLQGIFGDQSIILRKSSTSPILKLTIQGKREKCEQILNEIQGDILLAFEEISQM